MSCGSLSDGEAPSSTCQPSDALAAGESEEGNVARRAVENSFLPLVMLRCEGGGGMS